MYSGSGYGMGMSPYNGYRSYGGMNSGYFGQSSSIYGNNMNNPENQFVRLAEENTRPAFDTIQTVVQTFGSINMMFESTYYALHSSFRAVLSVVEQMSVLKLKFSEIMSAFTTLRFIRWLYNKFTGSQSRSPLDASWRPTDSTSMPPVRDGASAPSPVNWPVLIYLTMTFAAPYLMWSMVSKSISGEASSSESEKDDAWTRGEGEHFVAVAQFDFNARSKEELSLKAGQQITLAPKDKQPRVRGWLLGSTRGKKSVGLVPGNYVKVLGKHVAEENSRRPPAPDIVNSTDQMESYFGK